MALEDKIKALEYEVNILKNEIQSTLLDIQEQILTYYYPSLRAEESSPSEGALRSFDAIPPGRGKEAPEERSIFPGSTVPLREIGEGLEGPFISSERQPPSRSEGETDWATFSKLVEWMSHSVERIGGERTRKVIEGYAKGGHLPPGSKDVLLQLISLGNEESSPQKVGMKEILDVLLKLNAALGHRADIGDALSLLEEEDFG